MRFTVKAKLACAFGAIIVLSMVAGGVAYVKLGDMISTADSMVLRAKRMEKATEVEKQILIQVRDEKNAILGTEAEAEQFAAEAAQSREEVRKTKDEVYALASEAGKKLLDNFAAAYSKMIAYQEEEFKLAKTDKAKANEHAHDGHKIVNDALEAMGAEAEVADGAERIGSVALVPLVLLADGDPELGAAVDLVDPVQPGRPDRTIVGKQADHEVVVRRALALEHAIEPEVLGGLAHRRIHREVMHDVGVVEPTDERLDVGPLGGAQVHELAADDRSTFR